MFKKHERKVNYIYKDSEEELKKIDNKVARMILVLPFLFIFMIIIFSVNTIVQIRSHQFLFDSSSKYEISDMETEMHHRAYKIDFTNDFVLLDIGRVAHNIRWVSMSKKRMEELETFLNNIISDPNNKALSDAEYTKLKLNGNAYKIYTYDKGIYYFKDVEQVKEFERLVRYNKTWQ